MSLSEAIPHPTPPPQKRGQILENPQRQGIKTLNTSWLSWSCQTSEIKLKTCFCRSGITQLPPAGLAHGRKRSYHSLGSFASSYHPLGMQYTTYSFYIKLYHISTDIEATISEILIAYLSLWFVVKEISRRNEIIMTLMAAFLLLHHR